MAKNIKDINIKIQTSRRLMTNLIVKQKKRAFDNETKESAANYQYYYNAYNKIDELEDYDYWTDEEILEVFPTATPSELEFMRGYKNMTSLLQTFTEGEKTKLLNVKRLSIIKNYKEINEYYRMVMGLPSLEDEINNNFIYYEGVEIHKLEYVVKTRLRREGYFDTLFIDNPDKHYIRYIGRDIDLIVAREAEEFEILSYPKDRTDQELYAISYNKERELWLTSDKNDYYMYNTDFFEPEQLVALKLRALINYELESKRPSTHKSQYTLEEASNIWKEHGLILPKNMPELYRNSCTFVLNYLLMFKGTNHVMEYITEKLFSGLQLYKYFIRKTLREDITFPLTGNEKPEDVYKVEFILRPFKAMLPYEGATGVISEDKILSYDDVVRMDPRWRDIDSLKKAVFEEEFSFVESKYLSLGSSINLTKFGHWYAIMTRYIIENRKAAEEYNIQLKSSSSTHTFFAVFLYYLALSGFSLNRYHIFETDTIPELGKLYGFSIPENFDELKILWISEFTNTELEYALDNFPNALNNNSTFLEMLITMEKSMGMHDIFDRFKRKARNIREFKVIQELERAVREVKRVPEVFGMASGTETSTTFNKLLKVVDPLLFTEYERITQPFFITNPTDEELAKRENLVIELDNLTQEIISNLTAISRPNGDNIIRMENVLDTSQRFLTGLSKFLLYILKTFKAYSVDFINEGGLLKLGPDEEYQYNFDNIKTHVRYNINERMNIGSNDRIKIKYLKPIAITISEVHDELRIRSPYGDIEIYDGEGIR